ncbi:hypothetical protein JQX09_07630 [Sulfitobacter pseudonitzschiae]|uniref:Uncharacterized protein n=1 Tax=Pseudosulfitobacter pseudonitzschiae TaxID=1402135 RepID=A0A9Q2RV27_9RHOB|nr:hypothetical protein [Pseudosulfitobacter pseudonitzschiae]MBM2291776.1 hypothetical protein [Pseudosulfitobacter pseudonitzschiae]MBM2296694.1 hypothetical protein [Pseudosulfitobacter pseudonitzschiae]MBM2301607.1 hypothetical protein [Pseudosulfitobacter pseudonitzschiae]MBM2311390.1 hypothetical protein [Pseudosulfitobacter pseudonitzschiae]MBM2316304.1 hypothetical protein [Pseudosulfitobacter pseudonitzschiae]
MKMTIQKFSEAHSARVSGGIKEILVIFSQNLLDDLKIGGERLSDLEAGICENSAPQTPQSRRSGQAVPVSPIGNSRIGG